MSLQLHMILITRKFIYFRGVNNFFEIKRKTKLAVLYNDHAVLENHHAAFFFGLTHQPEMDVLKKYNWKEYADCRKFIIEIILQTDMDKHFSYIKELNEKVDSQDFKLKEQQRFVITGLVHAVDIGAQSKPFYLAKLWSMKILSEFFS